jgi:cysteine desulfuration protein SufE
MAMASILTAGLENCTAQEINAIDDQIVFEIFGNELSMGKNLGLTNMLRVSKHLANLS